MNNSLAIYDNVPAVASWSAWRQSLTSGVPGYWWHLLAIWTLVVMTSLMVFMSMLAESPESLRPVMARCVGDATFTVLCVHLILRPYMKLVFLPQKTSAWYIMRLVVLLYAVSLLMLSFSFMLGRLDPTGFTKLEVMTMGNSDNPAIQIDMTSPTMVFLGATNYTLTLGVWVVCYLFYQNFQQRKQLLKQVHEAQLQQLTHHINPHFLFNAFNSIRGMIFEDQNKAADLVTELSELFRLQMQSSLQVTRTLAEEWQLCQRYLALEQVRLEERLKVVLQVEEQLWQQQIPTLALLTLIENGIKHGIAPNMKGGTLSITAQSYHGQLTLRVQNPMAPEAYSVKGTGSGLKNVQARLNLMYQQQASFRVEKTRHLYTVIMSLPMEQTHA